MRRARIGGFVYVGLLVAVALVASGAAAFLTYYSESARREREAELLRIGAEMVRAIQSYYESSPGTVKQYPRELKDLLDDPRVVSLRRHLRRVHTDPMTGVAMWGLVEAPAGGIMGIYSQSLRQPLKQAGFPPWVLVRAQPGRYSDLRFVYVSDQRR